MTCLRLHSKSGIGMERKPAHPDAQTLVCIQPLVAGWVGAGVAVKGREALFSNFAVFFIF